MANKVRRDPPPASRPRGGVAKYIRDVVCVAPAKKLDQLAASPDPTIALAAGWERVRRKTPAKIVNGPEGSDKSALAFFNTIPGPDKADLAAFVSLVAERTRCQVPKLWGAAIRHAKYSPNGAAWFPTDEEISPIKKTALKSMGGRLIPHREGEYWIVDEGEASAALPADDRIGAPDWAKVRQKGDMAYVAMYSHWPDAYTVCAVKRGTSRIVWSSTVWANGGYLQGSSGWGRSGSSEHFVELQLAGDKLAVFGISGTTAYVEVFDAKTGKNECRFSTSYFPPGGRK